MRIAVYQIDPERDRNGVLFESSGRLLRLQGTGEIDAGIYQKVFDGRTDAGDLEEVYERLNGEKPEGFRGRSLAVSDVVEVKRGRRSEFWYCEPVGFRSVSFDASRCPERAPAEKLRAVLCEPGKTARTAEIGTELEDLQKAVGGLIETYYPFGEDVCIVCNDEGKLNGMKPCRAIYGEDGRVRDVIFGPFLICSCSGEDFGSLDAGQLERYGRMFRLPERYFRLNGEIRAVPYVPAGKEERER